MLPYHWWHYFYCGGRQAEADLPGASSTIHHSVHCGAWCVSRWEAAGQVVGDGGVGSRKVPDTKFSSYKFFYTFCDKRVPAHLQFYLIFLGHLPATQPACPGIFYHHTGRYSHLQPAPWAELLTCYENPSARLSLWAFNSGKEGRTQEEENTFWAAGGDGDGGG